jgi:hypothetical protein
VQKLTWSFGQCKFRVMSNDLTELHRVQTVFRRGSVQVSEQGRPYVPGIGKFVTRCWSSRPIGTYKQSCAVRYTCWENETESSICALYRPSSALGLSACVLYLFVPRPETVNYCNRRLWSWNERRNRIEARENIGRRDRWSTAVEARWNSTGPSAIWKIISYAIATRDTCLKEEMRIGSYALTAVPII